LLPKAIIEGNPYKIRAMLICGASLITAWPDPALWRKALGELEFLVTMDLQLTADAAYADIVLPVTTAFEQASYCYYGNALRWRDRLIEPLGQARPDYDILVELADRLGYGQVYPRTRQELLQKLLHGSGFTLEDVMQADKQVIQKATAPMEYRKWEKGLLRADGQPGFQTPSGKFEIKSTVLEQYGHNGLPHYEESWETAFSDPRLAEKYPLILGTGPFKPDMKSCLRAIPGFIAKYPHPLVQLHPQDAEPRGIADGDQVKIKTARGEVLMRVQVTDGIMPGFAYAQVGGGGPLGPPEWQQANANTLTDMAQFDPISGFPVYKTLLCQIAKKKRTRKGIAVQDPSLGCVG
jgi:anaerobic selenocysteine-containing dehydrogenase